MTDYLAVVKQALSPESYTFSAFEKLNVTLPQLTWGEFVANVERMQAKTGGSGRGSSARSCSRSASPASTSRATCRAGYMPAWHKWLQMTAKGARRGSTGAAAGRRSRRRVVSKIEDSSRTRPLRNMSSRIERRAAWFRRMLMLLLVWYFTSHFMLRVIFALPWEGFSHARSR